MNQKIKVGICIPIYNMDKTIEKTIQSALRQTYTKCTIYILDNCSTDNSWSIITNLANKFTNILTFKNTAHLSMADNWNKVLMLAKDEDYLNILSADDILEPTFIEDCLKPFEISNKQLSYVYSERYNIKNNQRENQKSYYKSSAIIKGIEEYIINIKSFHTAPCQLLINNKVLKEVNYLDTKFATAADMHLTLKLCSKYDIGYIHKPLVGYNISDGMTANNAISELQVSLFSLLKNDIILNYCPINILETTSILQKYIQEFCSRFCINTLINMLKNNKNTDINQLKKYILLASSYDLKVYNSLLFNYIMSNHTFKLDYLYQYYSELYPRDQEQPYTLPNNSILLEKEY